jgi:repressor LexA
MRAITERQTEILSYIEKFIGDNGYSPTFKEIGDHFHITPKGAYDHITYMIKKGFVKNQNGKPRTLTVIKRGQV